MQVDLHNHVIPPTVVEAVRKDPDRFGMRLEEKDGQLYFQRHGRMMHLQPEFYDVEAKIAAMDRMKLDVAAISASPPAFFMALKGEDAAYAAKLNNDGIAQMAAKYPKRLRGMGFLPMQEPEMAIAELERIVREYKFKCIELPTSVEGEQLSEPKFRKVLKTIEQLGCFVFTHPYTCVAKGGIDQHDFYNLIGFPLDTTIMVGHLIMSGAMDDLKKLNIVLAHGGGFMPYQIGRFNHGHKMRKQARTGTETPPYESFKRFYFDALTHDTDAARYLIDKVGADRVVIGTDHPFDMGPEDLPKFLASIPRLTDKERDLLFSGNALRLLGEA